MMWHLVTLFALVVIWLGAWVALSRRADPRRPGDGPLLPTPERRCHSCLRWYGGELDQMAYCGHTKKAEERHDGCSNWTRRAHR